MLETFWGSFVAGMKMIVARDPELYTIVFLSLKCTGIACLVASAVGTPIAFTLANYTFPGKRIIILLLNTFQALPTVVVGLTLYMFIAGNGPFGAWKLLYSWKAIAIGQFFLILPLVTMFILAALLRLDVRYRETALTLGASEIQAAVTVFREARFAVVAAICAAFGRGIAEVGVSMMLGGNIQWQTRTMTTAMALNYDKGEFTLSLALGVVLLLVALLLNAGLAFFQGRVEN